MIGRLFAGAALVLAGAGSSSGCSLDRAGLGSLDASALLDGAPLDGGAEDADLDARVEPPADAFVPDDALAPDGGPGCSPADERCEVNVRWYCEGGALQSEDCTASRHCDDSAGAPACVANVCAPGVTRCSAAGTAVLTCDALGTGESRAPCSRGCDAGACRPETPCGAAILATMSSGTMRVDLCGAGADQTHSSACPYVEQSPAGEDILIRLEVDRRRAIRFEARQVSPGETIDPNLSLRSACEDVSSEIWCHEDTAGQDEDFIETLDPGDYFLVVDRHERVGTSCGQLDVTITPM